MREKSPDLVIHKDFQARKPDEAEYEQLEKKAASG
jgi:hypothetical protein